MASVLKPSIDVTCAALQLTNGFMFIDVVVVERTETCSTVDQANRCLGDTRSTTQYFFSLLLVRSDRF